MADDDPGLLEHVSVGVADIERAAAFYDRVLATIGAKRLFDSPQTMAYGRLDREFWIGPPIDGGSPSVGNGSHVAFRCASRAEVDAFHREALAAGGVDDGAPGPHANYSPRFYGAFVRDPDGHKIEAMFWDLQVPE
jgi:catechol 2,3-dioxygenase-like lactoylglutathione lyase family enzyme